MTHFTLALLLAVQAQAEVGTLQGRVTDASQAGPVAGTLVEVVGAGFRAESDSTGSYQLSALRAGWHRLRFQRFGYRTVELQAYVRDGGVTRLDIALLVHPLPLPQVEVTGRVARSGTESGSLDDLGAHAGARSLTPQEGGQPLFDRPELPNLLASLSDVAQRPDGGSGLQMRGGSADHNLMLLDGAPLLNPVHAMGMAGALNPDAIAVVDVFAGVVPAQFGGRLSGVVAIESRQPDRERWRARGGADGFSLGLTLDGPLPLGRGGLLLSGRRSSSGVLAALYERGTQLPRFHDLFASLSLDAGPGTLRLSSYRSSDELTFAEVPEASEDAPPAVNRNSFAWDGGTDAVSWRGARAELVGWRASTDAAGSWRGTAGPHTLVSRVQNIGVRSVVSWTRAGGWIRAGAGLEHTLVRYGLEHTFLRDAPETRTTEAAISGEWHESLGERVAFTAALRASVLTGGDPALEPRVSFSLTPSAELQLDVGYSRSRQFLQSLRNQESALDVAVPAEYLGFLDAEESSAVSDQVTASLQGRPAPGAQLALDVYGRWLDGLVLVAPSTPEPLAIGGFTLGKGRAMGALASAELVRDKWQATTSYHLGSASRTASGTEYRPSFQRTHWAMAGAAYRISRHVTVRSALRAGSGSPTSPIGEGFSWEASDPVRGEGDLAGNPVRATGAVNDTKLPAYIRLDLGAQAGWEVTVAGRAGRISTFLTIENLLDRRNVLTYQIDPATGVLLPIPLRPMSLNAGLRIEY